MKFLHIADLHIGKTVNDFSMLEDQKFILEQIIGMASANQVDGVVIAGDIYDRAIPPAEAVTLFDSFLTGLSEKGVQVLMISGNHDSPERISFGESLLCRQGVHIAGTLKDRPVRVRIKDKKDKETEGWETEFVLLPFVKPAQVGARTSQEAVSRLLECYWEEEKAWETGERQGEKQKKSAEALENKFIVPQTSDRPGKTRVLITHFFVTDAGREPELSDSESTIHVGGLDNVDAGVFEGFDYVALGHIHKPQQIGSHPIWYAGSPLQYSFGETRQVKSALLVSIGPEGLREVKQLPLRPLRRMRKIKGSLRELLRGGGTEELSVMAKSETVETTDMANLMTEGNILPEGVRVLGEVGGYRQDYIQAILTDKGELIDPIGTLRSVYPNVMQIVREDTQLSPGGQEQAGRSRMLAEKKDALALFRDFYETVREEELSEDGSEVIVDTIRELEGKM